MKDGNILERIVAVKREEVAHLEAHPRATASENLLWAAKAFGPRRDFADALRFPRLGNIALIAEVKKASPSAGVIKPDFDAVTIAKAYEAAGASCLSVLTDEQFFQGSLKYLQAIRDVVQLPILRKDFIIHERQILESIEAGADAILLIVAILNDEELWRFHKVARAAGLAVLVEVHDETEMRRALACEAEIIGINNRDLRTFKVDLATTEKLAKMASGRILVAESGINTRADVERLERCGAHAILVGESLMRAANLEEKVKTLIGE